MEPCGGRGAGLPCPAQPRLASRPPPLRPEPRLTRRICPALTRGVSLQRAPPEDPPTGSAASGSRQEAVRAGGTGLGRTARHIPLRHLPVPDPLPLSRTRAAQRPADPGPRSHRLVTLDPGSALRLPGKRESAALVREGAEAPGERGSVRERRGAPERRGRHPRTISLTAHLRNTCGTANLFVLCFRIAPERSQPRASYADT